MDIFTSEQLAFFDGTNGKPAYIAYKGKVYDVTDSSLWKNGSHAGAHQAGVDLTEALSKAPHTEQKLGIFPVVAEFDSPELPAVIKPDDRPPLKRLYDKYHPHPVAVHLPMGLVPFALLMQLIYLYMGNFLFFYAGYFAIVVALVGSAGAAATGIMSWKVNYGMSKIPIFQTKASLSAALILLLLAASLSGVKYLDGLNGIAMLADGTSIYTMLIAVNTLLIVALGYNGGRLSRSSLNA